MPLPDDFEWIIKEAVLAAHEEQIKEHGGSLGVRSHDLLDSALARPQQVAAYSENVTISELAAYYGLGIIRNHPFVDGNKRVGSVVLEYFLLANGYELNVSDLEFYQAIVALGSSEIEDTRFIAWVQEHSIYPRPE